MGGIATRDTSELGLCAPVCRRHVPAAGAGLAGVVRRHCHQHAAGPVRGQARDGQAFHALDEAHLCGRMSGFLLDSHEKNSAPAAQGLQCDTLWILLSPIAGDNPVHKAGTRTIRDKDSGACMR
jgi:hypothetical protein